MLLSQFLNDYEMIGFCPFICYYALLNIIEVLKCFELQVRVWWSFMIAFMFFLNVHVHALAVHVCICTGSAFL